MQEETILNLFFILLQFYGTGIFFSIKGYLLWKGTLPNSSILNYILVTFCKELVWQLCLYSTLGVTNKESNWHILSFSFLSLTRDNKDEDEDNPWNQLAFGNAFSPNFWVCLRWFSFWLSNYPVLYFMLTLAFFKKNTVLFCCSCCLTTKLRE